MEKAKAKDNTPYRTVYEQRRDGINLISQGLEELRVQRLKDEAERDVFNKNENQKLKVKVDKNQMYLSSDAIERKSDK